MKLKRIFAGIAAAAAMLGGLAIGVGSANAAPTGDTELKEITSTDESITITNAQDGTTFNAYQLATFTKASATAGTVDKTDGTKVIGTLEMTTPNTANDALTSAIEALNKADPTPEGWSDVTITSAYTNNVAAFIATLNSGQFRALAKQLAQNIDGMSVVKTTRVDTDSNGSVVLDGLVPGWYLVTSATTGDAAEPTSPAIVPSTVNGYESIARKDGNGIDSITLGELVAKHSNLPVINKTNGKTEGGTKVVGINDVVPYTVTTKLAGASTENGIVTYQAITDTPSTGLTIDGKSIKVTVKNNGTDTEISPYVEGSTKSRDDDSSNYDDYYKVSGFVDDNTSLKGDGTKTFSIDLSDYARKHPELAGTPVTITYNGTVNAKAVDNVNNRVTFDNNVEFVQTDTAYLGKFEFRKIGVNDDEDGLGGAKFQVVKKGTDTPLAFTVAVTDKGECEYTYVPDAGAGAQGEDATSTSPGTLISTPSDGNRGHVTVLGLPDGSYTLTESTVPNGYSEQFKPEFTVNVTGSNGGDNNYHVTWSLEDQNAYGLVNKGNNDNQIFVKNIKSITQLPLTGAAGIGMIIAVAVLLAGAGALIGFRTRAVRRQMAE